MEKNHIDPNAYLISEPIKECPECGCKQIIKDDKHAELYCANCGLIVAEDIVDLGPEWRVFNSEHIPRIRTGPPSTLRMHDHGLSTMVTFIPKDPGSYKLKKWQQRTSVANTTERTLTFALSETDRMASALGLPLNIREDASKLCRKAIEEHLTKGRSIEAITSAILYIVCRWYGVARTLQEIKKVSRVGLREIRRAYLFLMRELKFKITLSSSVEFVPRFCSSLELDGSVQSTAIEIIKRAEEQGITNGRGPIGIAAAAIYIAAILSNQHRSQKDVANATGVTEVTIRNRFKEISEQLDIK